MVCQEVCAVTIEQWVPVILAVVASLPGFGALLIQLRKSRYDLLSSEAETSAKFEQIARDAAQSIIDKSSRIKILETQVIGMQSQVTTLQIEKSMLQDRNSRLERRVMKLENLLNAHEIPFPSEVE